ARRDPGRARRARPAAGRGEDEVRRRNGRAQRAPRRRRAARDARILAPAPGHRPPARLGDPAAGGRRLRAAATARGRAHAPSGRDRAQPRRVALDRRGRHEPRNAAPAHEGAERPEGTEMSMKCGIVGMPNVGKSTLFNALTRAGIAAENYPFCTIDPNVGVVEVPDARLPALAAIAHPEKVIPATVEFVDIAGLVAGASKGEGLGNQFLANIRETDAIAHVVRCFEDDNVVHVAGKIDPGSDIETINTELALADLASVEKQLQKYERAAKAGGDKEAQRIVAALKKVEAVLDRGRPARTAELYHEELETLRPFFLLTMKPTMYVAN